jgi:prevent-host-death family protein
MVMKKTTQPLAPRPRRIGVAEAKSRLSELLRQAVNGPTIIHSRGRDVAVVLAVEDYDRLTAEHPTAPGGGAAFLARVDALKERYGGGVEAFTPERIQFEPVDPFARKRRTRS